MLVSVRELMKVGAGDKGVRIVLHVAPRTPLTINGMNPICAIFWSISSAMP
jgi:hypothetical protein